MIINIIKSISTAVNFIANVQHISISQWDVE